MLAKLRLWLEWVSSAVGSIYPPISPVKSLCICLHYWAGQFHGANELGSVTGQVWWKKIQNTHEIFKIIVKVWSRYVFPNKRFHTRDGEIGTSISSKIVVRKQVGFTLWFPKGTVYCRNAIRFDVVHMEENIWYNEKLTIFLIPVNVCENHIRTFFFFVLDELMLLLSMPT